MFKVLFCVLVVDFVVLTMVGAMPAEQPYTLISQIGTLYCFAFFLVILPLLGIIENPDTPPASIEEDFKSHYAPDDADAGDAALKPAE